MQNRRQILRSVSVNGAGTLASRVLGMLRDMATAALLGLSAGALDSLVLAFRIPNLFRAVFGEGALSAGYLPLLVRHLDLDRRQARRFATSVFLMLAALLGGLTILGELICWLLWQRAAAGGTAAITLELCALLLPYVVLICLSAHLAATLHALERFAAAAVAPWALSLVWLAAVLWVAPRVGSGPFAQARIVACAILLSGVVQLLVQFAALVKLGFLPLVDLAGARSALRQVAVRVGPIAVGMGVTRVSTFFDSLLAWLLAAEAPRQTIAWLGHAVDYPLRSGATGALYCAERLCHFPVGLLGIAVATAIFPWLSRHAAREARQKLAADVTFALRLVLWLGIPASAGLILLAEPMTRLIFERGEFTSDDSQRTARLIQCYAVGVWAYCALPVLLRGFYAVDDRWSPLKAAITVVAVDATLNLALVWTLGELALPLSTSLGGILQFGLLARWFHGHVAPLEWSLLAGTAARSIAATSVMVAVGAGLLGRLPAGGSTLESFGRVMLPLAVCMAVFYCCFRSTKERNLLAEALH